MMAVLTGRLGMARRCAGAGSAPISKATDVAAQLSLLTGPTADPAR